jgi:hypothetical protein
LFAVPLQYCDVVNVHGAVRTADGILGILFELDPSVANVLPLPLPDQENVLAIRS